MQYRQKLIRAATFLGGIYFFLEYVLPWKQLGVPIEKYDSLISNGFIAVGAMAVGLGLINILIVHGGKIAFKRKGALNSAALIVGLVLMMLVTANDWRGSQEVSTRASRLFMLKDFTLAIEKDFKEKREGVPELSVRTEALFRTLNEELAAVELDLNLQSEVSFSDSNPRKDRLEKSFVRLKGARESLTAIVSELEQEFDPKDPDFSNFSTLVQALAKTGAERSTLLNLLYEMSFERRSYEFLFYGLFTPLGSAMFSMLGFYIAAAAYRAFRIRSAESALMMLAAILVMLGQIPFARYFEFLGLTDIRLFLLQVPNAAAFRAIHIGASVGFVVMAFRMWLSIESESFGEEQA